MFAPAQMLYDDMFPELCLPSPSTNLYISLLVLRDVMFGPWITHPRQHTPAGPSILSMLCNIVGILELRFMVISQRKEYHPLFLSLKNEDQEALVRPMVLLYHKLYDDVVQTLTNQVIAITGSSKTFTHQGSTGDAARSSRHFGYMILTQGKGYLGRTQTARKAAQKMEGMPLRWSENLRDLDAQEQAASRSSIEDNGIRMGLRSSIQLLELHRNRHLRRNRHR